MVTPDLLAVIRGVHRSWGLGNSAMFLAPSLAVSRDGQELWSSIEQASVERRDMREIVEHEMSIDVLDRLADVDAPTLVLHRVNEQYVPPQSSRHLVTSIRGAQLVYLDGMDHLPWLGDRDAVVGEVGQFIRGDFTTEQPGSMTGVLITDIVGSTELVIGMGDKRWNEVLDRHDEIAAAEVLDGGGRLIKSTGDGILAVFDDPSNAVRCATRLRDALTHVGLQIRAGIAVGEVLTRHADVSGVSVHFAERLAKLAGPGQIFVSRGVAIMLAESEFQFVGFRPLKGIPGGRSVFELR
jgi:hypothetical protein